MNCRDFERLWNDRLDARAAGEPAAELNEHAENCPVCRALGAGYRLIEGAGRSPARVAAVGDDFADRVLAAAAVYPLPSGGTARWRPARVVGLAAAATLVAAVTLGLRARGPEAEPHAARGRPADALALAVSAAFDLDPPTLPAAPPAPPTGGPSAASDGSTAFGLPAGAAVSADVWETVGERVSAGVRPLEGSARHAFGFLLDVPAGDEPPAPKPAKGA